MFASLRGAKVVCLLSGGPYLVEMFNACYEQLVEGSLSILLMLAASRSAHYWRFHCI